MTQAEKATVSASRYFWSSVVAVILAWVIDTVVQLQNQDQPTITRSHLLGVMWAFLVATFAWLGMWMAYRKLLLARRVESEAAEAVSEAHKT